jgi:hypothetical protein
VLHFSYDTQWVFLWYPLGIKGIFMKVVFFMAWGDGGGAFFPRFVAGP